MVIDGLSGPSKKRAAARDSFLPPDLGTFPTLEVPTLGR